MSALFSLASFIVVIGIMVFFSMKFIDPPQTASDSESRSTVDAIDSAKEAKNLIEVRSQSEVNTGSN